MSVRATDESAMGERTAAECADDLACVREVGARARAAKAVVTRLAELGDTVVVRVSLVDVRGGTQETARQEVVRAATSARLTEALERVARDIARPFVPPRPVEDGAWYERWEVWTGAGAVMAIGGTAAAVLLLGGEDGPTHDATVTPP